MNKKKQSTNALKRIILSLLIGFLLSLVLLYFYIQTGKATIFQLHLESYQVTLFDIEVYNISHGEHGLVGTFIPHNIIVVFTIIMFLCMFFEEIVYKCTHKIQERHHTQNLCQ